MNTGGREDVSSRPPVAFHLPEPRALRHISGIDHCVLLVRDLDKAEWDMTRLGFRPTPRGYHSAHMGTANATVVFRDGTYFETLGVAFGWPALDVLALLSLAVIATSAALGVAGALYPAWRVRRQEPFALIHGEAAR